MIISASMSNAYVLAFHLQQVLSGLKAMPCNICHYALSRAFGVGLEGNCGNCQRKSAFAVYTLIFAMCHH